MIARRGFLKVLGAIAASTGIIHYAEAKVLMPEQGSWIEDKGDYYIVRIPDGKTFARETLDKPTIFGFGRDSSMREVTVNGFSNLYLQSGASTYDCAFDARGYSIEGRTAALEVYGMGGMLEMTRVWGAGPVKVLSGSKGLPNAEIHRMPVGVS